MLGPIRGVEGMELGAEETWAAAAARYSSRMRRRIRRMILAAASSTGRVRYISRDVMGVHTLRIGLSEFPPNSFDQGQ